MSHLLRVQKTRQLDGGLLREQLSQLGLPNEAPRWAMGLQKQLLVSRIWRPEAHDQGVGRPGSF